MEARRPPADPANLSWIDDPGASILAETQYSHSITYCCFDGTFFGANGGSYLMKINTGNPHFFESGVRLSLNYYTYAPHPKKNAPLESYKYRR
jgi:hypothetical protein